MKELVEQLVAACGSLREASRRTGIPHSTLINWRDGNVPAVIREIERIQEVLKMPDSKVWKKAKGKGGK